MAETTRAEHMAWCKQRAWDEFNYYLPLEGFDSAARNAKASMLSDLGKHPDTRGLASVAGVMLLMPMRSKDDIKRFIEGFN